jgi:4-hydroxybenzoate polyprenyltransferase
MVYVVRALDWVAGRPVAALMWLLAPLWLVYLQDVGGLVAYLFGAALGGLLALGLAFNHLIDYAIGDDG